MIKSKRLAYDGRGNAVAKSEEELSSAISGNIFAELLIERISLNLPVSSN